MITVSIQGSDMGEIRDKAARMFGFGPRETALPDNPPVELPPAPPVAQAQSGEPGDAPAGKRKPGRPKKEKPAEPEAPPAAPPAAPAAPAASPAEPGFDAMRAALQTVDTDGGFENAVRILKQFGYRKVKEVKPEYFAAIIAECQKAKSA